MNLLKKLWVILPLSLLFVSCVNQRKVMDGWVNKEEYQLIESWGPPARKASNGSTGEILIYASQFYIYGQMYYKYTMFYCYENGIIYHWLIQNGRVAPQQMDVNLYVH